MFNFKEKLSKNSDFIYIIIWVSCLLLFILYYGITNTITSYKENKANELKVLKQQEYKERLNNQPSPSISLISDKEVWDGVTNTIIIGVNFTDTVIVNNVKYPISGWVVTFDFPVKDLKQKEIILDVIAENQYKKMSEKIIIKRTPTEEIKMKEIWAFPDNKLEFSMTNIYEGNGIIKSTIDTNITSNILDVDIYSITELYSKDERQWVDYWDEYRKWYVLQDAKDKNFIPTITMSTSCGWPNSKNVNEVVISKDWIWKKELALYTKVVEKYNYWQINELYKSSDCKDNLISTFLNNKKTLEKDKRVQISYTIAPILLSWIDVSSVKLPSICKINKFKTIQNTDTYNIICTEYLNIDMSKDSVTKEKDCINEIWNLCIVYVDKVRNTTQYKATSKCSEYKARLPEKWEVKWYEKEILNLFQKNGTSHIRTSTFDTEKMYNNKYIYARGDSLVNPDASNRATADSDKRNYMSYICIK